MPASFSIWTLSALAILLFAVALPGVSVMNLSAAIFLAVIFGGANALIKPSLRYLEVPCTRFTLALFGTVANGGLIFWATIGKEAIRIDNIFIAYFYAAALSLAMARISLDPPRLGFVAVWVETFRMIAIRSSEVVLGRSILMGRQITAIARWIGKTPSYGSASSILARYP